MTLWFRLVGCLSYCCHWVLEGEVFLLFLSSKKILPGFILFKPCYPKKSYIKVFSTFKPSLQRKVLLGFCSFTFYPKKSYFKILNPKLNDNKWHTVVRGWQPAPFIWGGYAILPFFGFARAGWSSPAWTGKTSENGQRFMRIAKSVWVQTVGTALDDPTV